MDNQEIFVIETIPLAIAHLPNGDEYHIVATNHNMNWPGTNSPTTFAVYYLTWRNGIYGIVQAWGFFSEADCMQFLTSRSEKRYTVKDRQGNDESVVRMGLKVHPAFVVKHIEEILSSSGEEPMQA